MVGASEDGRGALVASERLDGANVAHQVAGERAEPAGLGASPGLRAAHPAALTHREGREQRHHAKADECECRIDGAEQAENDDQPNCVRDKGGGDGDEGVQDPADIGGQPGQQLAAAVPIVPAQ